MKYLTSLFLTLFMIPVVNANVYVIWGTSGGYAWSGTPNSGFLGDGSGNSALVQLIWSSDNVIDDASMADPNYVSGNDVWLADYVYTEDGVSGNYDDFLYATTFDSAFNDGGARPDGGYIYGRIFQDNSVEAGDWYYAGSIIAASDLDPTIPPPDTPTPQSYNMTQVGEHNLTGVDINFLDGTYGAQVQPVPEPGTMALFALGVATLAASRRRRKVQA